MKIIRVITANLGRTIILSAVLVIALAALWAARDNALSTRTNDTSTEQPAGPAGSVLDDTTPPTADTTSSSSAPATPTTTPITPTEPADPPAAHNPTATQDQPAMVTTNAKTGDVGPIPVITQDEPAPTTVTTTPACTTAGCPGT